MTILGNTLLGYVDIRTLPERGERVRHHTTLENRPVLLRYTTPGQRQTVRRTLARWLDRRSGDSPTSDHSYAGSVSDPRIGICGDYSHVWHDLISQLDVLPDQRYDFRILPHQLNVQLRLTHHPRRIEFWMAIAIARRRVDTESRVQHSQLDPSDKELCSRDRADKAADIRPGRLHEREPAVELDVL